MVRLLRAFLLVAPMGALVACAQVLGIQDVPVPDGGVADGPVEGCNGGIEDCANGIDDNCDGLIDCADPVCQGASYQCVPDAPSGWTLVAFAASTGSTLPVGGCSGAYGASTAQGHDGLGAAPATCDCSCPQSTATGATCSNPSVDVWGGSTGCGGAANGNVSLSSTCIALGGNEASITTHLGTVTSQGSCGTATPIKDVPAVSWQRSYVACGFTAPVDDGGCNSGNQCLQLPTSSFDAKPCVEQTGDVACPSATYTNKTLVFTQLSDDRDCSACSCDASGASCSASLTAYDQGNCTGSPASTTFGSCIANGVGIQSVHVDSMSANGGACAKSGGAPTGSATESVPVTVCCP